MKVILLLACALIAWAGVHEEPVHAQSRMSQSKRLVIAAGTLFDGKGHIFHNTRIVIEGSRIVAIDPKASPVDYDLRGLTVMPGWIDAHVHLTWIFGTDG